jgi:hypothetical protein
MKAVFLLFTILFAGTTANGQFTGSDVSVITLYSQNEKYYLKSIPYDNEFPSMRGRTLVYETGKPTPFYVFDRGFDSVDEDSNNLILSNDGEVIFFAISTEANEKTEGLKSITIYRHGKIIRSFTESEVNGCEKKKERCSLIYSNYDDVVDQEKSNAGFANYKKTFKAGVDDKEKFLSDFALFSSDDIVYLTDSKKQVHQFDLKEGAYLRSDSFDSIFEKLKSKSRLNRTELTHYEAPVYLTFPKLKDGRDTYTALASALGMKAADLIEPKYRQYRLYTFKMSVDISRDGNLEIESLDPDPELPREKLLAFFKANKFDISAVPGVFEKWHLSDEFFSFRNADDKVARQEKQQQISEERKRYAERLTLERIDGVYIPINLGECFTELDKLLPEIDRKEMMSVPERRDMILYHLSLGMWMRNNWGLWGGSRLQKYFRDKGLNDPEDMSSVVLFYYYDWLKEKKETWKQWEREPRRPFPEPADQRFADTIPTRPKP